MGRKTYYVTTPIYYANAEPHIGTACTTIIADVMARYKKLCGYEVFYLTGSDEHGQKILRIAAEAGVEPKAFVDGVVAKIKQTWQDLNIQYDYFVRTTDEQHKKAVQALYRKIAEKGDIYKAKYSGWYCTPCERYISLTESPDKTCPVCKRPTEFLEEDNYFFKLSNYQAKMLEFLKAHKDFIVPESRYNEVYSRVEMSIEDISISRASFSWGIPLPDDAEHVVWVWLDALTTYISALGYPDNKDNFNKYWPADVHFMAKDILWFHSVIWPCFLMSAGLEPPRQICAHGWWTVNGEKISKSKGNMILPRDVIAKFGVDSLRYFELREMVLGHDQDFTYKALMSRHNNELGNDLGNLVLRTLVMIGKYYEGKIPQPYENDFSDEPIRKMLASLQEPILSHIEHFQFSNALEKIWEIVRAANKYIDDQKPWVLAKEKSPKLSSVLYNLAEEIRIISVYLTPFMPTACDSIRFQLGLSSEKVTLPESLEFGQTEVGTRTFIDKPLFPKIEEEKTAG